jgi:hypothetical protein
MKTNAKEIPTYPTIKHYGLSLIPIPTSIGNSVFLIASVYELLSMGFPTGIWAINANTEKGELNINEHDGQITGTARFGIGTSEEYTNIIFGFWDDAAWKITFLKETELKWTNPSHDPIPNTGHGRHQIYTGYLFGGVAGKGTPITMAGSVVAFGGTGGTGGTAYRSVFGWMATFPASTSK